MLATAGSDRIRADTWLFINKVGKTETEVKKAKDIPVTKDGDPGGEFEDTIWWRVTGETTEAEDLKSTKDATATRKKNYVCGFALNLTIRVCNKTYGNTQSFDYNHYAKLTIADLKASHAKCHPREKDGR